MNDSTDKKLADWRWLRCVCGWSAIAKQGSLVVIDKDADGNHLEHRIQEV